MGISGSDVARDAGDVILMDDDFSSIVVGIREGRTIFDNLTKTIAYTVTHMVPEVIPILLNLAFGFPLGLNAILILCIDIGTELAPAISLAYEKAESDVMSRPPRNAQRDHLVTAKTVTYWYLMAGAWETLTCFLAFFLVFDHYGVSPHNLPFSDSSWNNTGGNDVVYVNQDRYPNGIDSDTQEQILAQAQLAFWVCLTGTQVVRSTATSVIQQPCLHCC
jgi:sodium/potassium-transporting ATPase subunit alpha